MLAVMIIEFEKIDNKSFTFAVDGEEIGAVYKHIDEYGQDCWMAVDDFDGLSVEGSTKVQAVENLLTQISLIEFEQELMQELFS